MRVYYKQFYQCSLVQFDQCQTYPGEVGSLCGAQPFWQCVQGERLPCEWCAPRARYHTKCDTQYCARQPCLKSYRIHTSLPGLKF